MYKIRIHAIKTANDDGSQAAVQTPDQIEKMVSDCNNVYSNAGIFFSFDKQKDFEFQKNSLLNHDITYPSDVKDKGITDDGVQHVIYRGLDGHINELFAGDVWKYNGITRAAGAPPAVGNPAGYTTDAGGIQHVIYRDSEGNVHELFAGDVWKHNVPNLAASAPKAAGDPFAYTTGKGAVQHIVYKGDDGNIHELFAGDAWKHNIINLLAGAPGAKGDPFAYTTAFGEVQHVVYRGVDDQIHELFAGDKWRHNTISSLAKAPPATGDPFGYVTQDYDRGIKDVQHVIYIAADGHIHELFAKDVWKHNIPTLAAGAPQAVGDPFGYTMHVDQYQHIVYKGNDNQIHELYSGDKWDHNIISVSANAPQPAGDPFGYIGRTGDTYIHRAERDKVALAHRGKLVVYFRYGDSLSKNGANWNVGQAGLNFSNPLEEYVAIANGETSGVKLAHEIGHYLHIGHTFGPFPKNVDEAIKIIKEYIATGKDKSKGLQIFDGDIDSILDTPPDPGPDLFESFYGVGSCCKSDKGAITVTVNFDDGSAPEKYLISPDRSNIMSYFMCSPCHLSEGQIIRINSALRTSNRRHLIE